MEGADLMEILTDRNEYLSLYVPEKTGIAYKGTEDVGRKTLEVYTIEPGTVLYHASCRKIDSFDRMMFLTPYLGVAKSVLLAERIYSRSSRDLSGLRTGYVYKFEATKPIDVYRNKSRGRVVKVGANVPAPEDGCPITTTREPGPFRSSQSAWDWCSENPNSGYWKFRIVAPITPFFSHHNVRGTRAVPTDPERFFSEWINYHDSPTGRSVENEEGEPYFFPTETASFEVVLSRPDRHLRLVSTTAIPGEELVREYHDRLVRIASEEVEWETANARYVFDETLSGKREYDCF